MNYDKENDKQLLQLYHILLNKICQPGCNFQFCTQGIVIYIFSVYQKSKFFSLLKKFSFSSLQFNHIYLSVHLQINHIYFLVHLQTLYVKQIGLFIISKSRQKKSFAMTTNMECSLIAPRPE